MKFFLLVIAFIFCSSCKQKENMQLETDLSMVQVAVFPSFYGEKKFVFNVANRQLLFKNFSSAVNDKDENPIFEASENKLFEISRHETDSLLSLCKNMKSSSEQMPIAPDQWGCYTIAVKKNGELIEIVDCIGMSNFIDAMVFLIRKKCKDEKVIFDLKRFR